MPTVRPVPEGFNQRYKEDIVALIKSLPPSQMREVKDFAEFLKQRKMRKTKTSFSEFCGIISKKDISLMTAAIEEGCEKVDVNGW